MLKILFSITCIFFIDLCKAQHTYGSFYTGDALVNYVRTEKRTKNEAIIMVPGANLSSYLYITTPDGRKGWADLFADKGYDVYMVNDPRYDFATGGIVMPFNIPVRGKAATPGSQQGWQNDIWSRWGFGSSEGNPYSNTLFPTDSFEAFARNYPYLGTSNDNYAEAIEAVIDSIKSKVWILAHSAGSSRAVSASRQKKKELVKGLILIEPAGPPDSADFPDLNGMHMLGVYGDYIASRNQTSRKLATEEAAKLFQKAGGIAGLVSLPEDSLVFGNSHIMMQDKNSEYVFNIIEHWLKQFTITTSLHEDKLNTYMNFRLYPNPSRNEVRISDTSIDGYTYCIYSIDGQLIKKATISNQKIDLADTPNGLLVIKFDLKEQIIVKKIIKDDY